MYRIVQAKHERFALAQPFRISRGVKTHADVVTVKLEVAGVTGWGEGVPYPRYGESVETALAEVDAIRAEIESGADRAALQSLLPPGAARNAVDCAMWDLEARRSGKSVAELIGAPEPGRMESALTIGLDTPEQMAVAAEAFASAPLIKVKVDANDPEGQLRAVREAAPDPKMIVDPNESWDEALLRTIEPLLVELNVDLIEQPVPAGADEWLEGFSPQVPVCADESVHVAADLEVVAKRYQVINVKLDKSGGLTAALELARATRARGLGLMTGCMISSSLSIAADRYIARMSDFVDLDGALWLAKDRAGGVSDKGGMLLPPSKGFWGTQ